MLKKSRVTNLFGLGILFLPMSAFASTATEMTKDQWLEKLKTVAPEVICKGFLEEESLQKKFKELNLDKEKCMSLIPPIYDKCQAQYYNSLPATMSRESASKWGRTIGECIGTDFATKYLVPESKTTDSSNSNTSEPTGDMTKDKWLEQLKILAPSMICKGFLEDEGLKKKFKERNIDNEKCLTLIPASFDKCQAQYRSSLPETINQESASTWGQKIGECIGSDFATKYLVTNSGPSNP